MRNEIVLFENQDVRLEVNVKDETVWLTQAQMAKLFGVGRSTITEHINNILNTGELTENTSVGISDQSTGGRKAKIYNLDMIIALGYRVNSKRATHFRIWATKVLKDYLLKGYAINQKRLEYLEKTVKLIDIAGRIDDEISASEAKEIIKVIGNYSNALNLLDDYDHRSVVKPKGTTSNSIITYEECMDVISKLRFNSDSNLFALERNEGLKAILGAIYQSFGSNDLYPTTEEKAANFFYMIIKNHVFIDGNTLVALTLLIAESNPKEKEILVDLVMNFLAN